MPTTRHNSHADLIKPADNKMYKAKCEGKDKIIWISLSKNKDKIVVKDKHAVITS